LDLSFNELNEGIVGKKIKYKDMKILLRRRSEEKDIQKKLI
jgi:ATP-dependent exoDNAse (exonuclease V) beta subunit